MLLPDLLQEATIRGIQIPANATRPILIDLIEKYQQPAAPGNPPPPPAQNQAPLAQNQVPPAQNQAPPAQNQAPLAQNQAPLAQNQAPPAQNQEPLAQNQAPPAGNHAPAAPQMVYDPNIANFMGLLAKAAADTPQKTSFADTRLLLVNTFTKPEGHYDLWDFLQSFHIRAPTYTPELRTHFALTTQLHDEIHIHFITHRTLGIVEGTPPHLVAAARSYICHVAAMFLLAGHPDSSKKIGGMAKAFNTRPNSQIEEIATTQKREGTDLISLHRVHLHTRPKDRRDDNRREDHRRDDNRRDDNRRQDRNQQNGNGRGHRRNRDNGGLAQDADPAAHRAPRADPADPAVRPP